jgi:hypothetical protein
MLATLFTHCSRVFFACLTRSMLWQAVQRASRSDAPSFAGAVEGGFTVSDAKVEVNPPLTSCSQK